MAHDYLFGQGNDAVRVQPSRGRIEVGDRVVRIKPKAMAVLECLIRAEGRVVTRNALFEAVWGRAIVSDATLSQCVVELRSAFGDSARDSRVIETVPRVGFRLVPAVTALPHTRSDHENTVVNDEQITGEPAHRRRLFAVPLLAVLGVLVLVVALAWRSPVTKVIQASSEAKTLAVLPFVDMSLKKDQGHFADGLAEELIHGLSQQEQLLVAGRTSSFMFKNRNEDLREVGRLLNVDHIVEGSVRKSDEAIRINVSLVDVDSGASLWSRSYERTTADYFRTKDEITEAVVAAMAIETGKSNPGHVFGTSSFEAYEHVMQTCGRTGIAASDSTRRDLEHLYMATEIDPQYAYAWGALSALYAWKKDSLAPNWRELSTRYLQKALALDPDAPQLLEFAAHYHVALEQWAEAEKVLVRLPGTHSWYHTPAHLEVWLKTGRGEEALELAERMYLRDPLAASVLLYLQHAYAVTGQTEKALEKSEELWALWKSVETAQEAMVTAFAQQDPAVTRLWLERAIAAGDASLTNAVMVRDLESPQFALDWLRHGEFNSPPDAYIAPVWAAHLGDERLALELLRRKPDPWALWMPIYAEVRRLDGFKDLVRELGLVDYWREFGWGDYCHPVGEVDFECVDSSVRDSSELRLTGK